jgi:hypothetical protein
MRQTNSKTGMEKRGTQVWVLDESLRKFLAEYFSISDVKFHLASPVPR